MKAARLLALALTAAVSPAPAAADTCTNTDNPAPAVASSTCVAAAGGNVPCLPGCPAADSTEVCASFLAGTAYSFSLD